MTKELETMRDIVLLLLIGGVLILAYVLFIGQLEVVLNSLVQVTETIHISVTPQVGKEGESSA